MQWFVAYWTERGTGYGFARPSGAAPDGIRGRPRGDLGIMDRELATLPELLTAAREFAARYVADFPEPKNIELHCPLCGSSLGYSNSQLNQVVQVWCVNGTDAALQVDRRARLDPCRWAGGQVVLGESGLPQVWVGDEIPLGEVDPSKLWTKWRGGTFVRAPGWLLEHDPVTQTWALTSGNGIKRDFPELARRMNTLTPVCEGAVFELPFMWANSKITEVIDGAPSLTGEVQ